MSVKFITNLPLLQASTMLLALITIVPHVMESMGFTLILMDGTIGFSVNFSFKTMELVG